jgi:hypothetical protein
VDPKEALLRRQTHAAADGDKGMEQSIAKATSAKTLPQGKLQFCRHLASGFSKHEVFSPVNTT